MVFVTLYGSIYYKKTFFFDILRRRLRKGKRYIWDKKKYNATQTFAIIIGQDASRILNRKIDL